MPSPTRESKATKAAAAAPLPSGAQLPSARLSRAEAIDAGAIYDVSDFADRQGFQVPVAISRNLWADVCNTPPESSDTPEARLADVLWAAHWSAQRGPRAPLREMTFALPLPVAVADRKYEMYSVRLVAEAGDDGNPVVTLYRHGE